MATKEAEAPVKEKATTKEAEAPLEPAGGDVDINTLDAGSGEGELGPVIPVGYWVKLGDVPTAKPTEEDPEPKDYSGSYGWVVESPWTSVPFANDSEETLRGWRFDEEKPFLIRTRGAGEVTIEVEAESIEFATDGRAGLFGHA